MNDWVKHNNFLRKLHKKDEMKVSKFTSALNSYVHRIGPRLQLNKSIQFVIQLKQFPNIF